MICLFVLQYFNSFLIFLRSGSFNAGIDFILCGVDGWKLLVGLYNFQIEWILFRAKITVIIILLWAYHTQLFKSTYRSNKHHQPIFQNIFICSETHCSPSYYTVKVKIKQDHCERLSHQCELCQNGLAVMAEEAANVVQLPHVAVFYQHLD